MFHSRLSDNCHFLHSLPPALFNGHWWIVQARPCLTRDSSFYCGSDICSLFSSAEWAKGYLMVFKTGQVEWSVPLKALEESIQQLIVLFIFWPFQCKLIEHTCTFFPYTDLLSIGILNINSWALARKITVFSCLCHWATPLEQLLKGCSTVVDEKGQIVSHSISMLSEDWDPADQSHKQIMINKLNAEPLHSGV